MVFVLLFFDNIIHLEKVLVTAYPVLYLFYFIGFMDSPMCRMLSCTFIFPRSLLCALVSLKIVLNPFYTFYFQKVESFHFKIPEDLGI